MDATNFLGTSGSGSWISSIRIFHPSHLLSLHAHFAALLLLAPPVWSCGWPASGILFLTGPSCMGGAGHSLRFSLVLWPFCVVPCTTRFGHSPAYVALPHGLALDFLWAFSCLHRCQSLLRTLLLVRESCLVLPSLFRALSRLYALVWSCARTLRGFILLAWQACMVLYLTSPKLPVVCM